MSAGATSPSRAPVTTVARLALDGTLIALDTARPERREDIDTAPYELASRGVLRRWATHALEKAGWWAHGDWWTDDNDHAHDRRVIPAERVTPGGI